MNYAALLMYNQPTIFLAPLLSFVTDFDFFHLKMLYEPLFFSMQHDN